jgi:hypothetical protein
MAKLFFRTKSLLSKKQEKGLKMEKMLDSSKIWGIKIKIV